jgi:soluble lytic murein transglycosylase
MPRASANIRTLPPVSRASVSSLHPFGSRAVALVLSSVLVLGCGTDVLGQTPQTQQAPARPHHTKRKATHPKSPACETGCKPDTTSPALDAATPEDAALQKELGPLARDVRHATPGSYEKLEAFANKNLASAWGQRAALALGLSNFATNHQPPALSWLEEAKGDALLEQYVLFYTAQAEHALAQNASAVQNFTILLTKYPNTVIKEQVLEAYVPLTVEIGRPQDGLDALETYPVTASRPSLLLARARAYEAIRKLTLAAKDYQVIYYKHPLADEAKDAGLALPRINKQLGKEFPYAGAQLQDDRAQAFYEAHRWKEARAEYEKLSAMLKDPANPVRQRALVRAAESRQHPKPYSSILARLGTSDPEADAERLYSLSQAYRSDKNETAMLTAIEQVAGKYPQSRWTEDALMAGGNYYWVNLDRSNAGHYYQRVLEAFPSGKNAYAAEWRIAWIAYLERQPYADEKISVFLRKYPVSGGAVNALYWLGRNAERSGNTGHARAYYKKAIERYPSSYFAYASQARLDKLGPGDDDPADFLAQIPAAPAMRPFDEPIAANVLDHWNRAQALRTIAFDASAELELKAAYTLTTSPRFLVEAAQAAFDQGHFATGMNYGRMAVPSFDSRKFSEVPPSVWKVLFPLPYESILRREAERNEFDPMFAAGLIRQESTFQADAVSHANAIGLMQILPKEGRRLAKERKVKFTKYSLFDPNINIELGMLYISDLQRRSGAPEYAAAAYNAGEDRLAQWRGERTYDDITEFVESIPITETREYVQIVLRNAAVYRLLYGEANKTTVSAGVNPGGSSR